MPRSRSGSLPTPTKETLLPAVEDTRPMACCAPPAASTWGMPSSSCRNAVQSAMPSLAERSIVEPRASTAARRATS